MKKNILFLISICACIILQAQNPDCTHNIKGIIIDSLPGKALQNAVISSNGAKEVISNAKGEFLLKNLCQGKIELHISHLQCEHVHIQFTLYSDSFILVYLQHSDQEFEGIKLSSKPDKSVHLNSVTSKALEFRKGSSISSMMQDIVSVTLLKTGSNVSKPMVNGLFGNRVIIVNNGIRQEGQNWGNEHAPEIDGFLANEIELIKGAESLRYGADGIGGIILIKPKSIFLQKPSSLNGECNAIAGSNGRYGILNVSLGHAIEGKLPFYWRVQGTLKQSGNTASARDIISNTGSKEGNYSVNIGIKKRNLLTELFYSEFSTSLGIYKGSQTGNLADLQRAMNSDRPLVNSGFTYSIDRPFQSVSHRLLKLRSEIALRSKNKIEFVFSLQKNHRSEYDVLRSVSAFQGPAFDYYINTNMAEIIFSHTDFHKLNYKAGVLALHQSNAYTGRFFIPGFYQNSVAAYLIAQKNIRKITIEVSTRADTKLFDYYLPYGQSLAKKQRNYSGIAYLLQATYKLRSDQKITLLHSSTWRAPAPNELYANGLHQGLASIEKGDSNIKVERSFSQSISWQFKHKNLGFESDLYFQYINGFINAVPGKETQLSIRGAFPVFNYVQNDVALYGMNLRCKYDITDAFSILLQSQLPFGYTIQTALPLNQMPAWSEKLSLAYENRILTTQIWFQYVAKQVRYTQGSDYLAPPPAYCIAGLDIIIQFKFFNQNMKLSLSCNNITNASYRDYLNRFRYFTDEQGRNISLRLTIPISYSQKNKSKP